LMVSRYRRGYALTPTPGGQELHLHSDEVIKDPMIPTLYPLSSCVEDSFRETDRTSSAWLGSESRSAMPCSYPPYAIELKRRLSVWVFSSTSERQGADLVDPFCSLCGMPNQQQIVYRSRHREML